VTARLLAMDHVATDHMLSAGARWVRQTQRLRKQQTKDDAHETAAYVAREPKVRNHTSPTIVAGHDARVRRQAEVFCGSYGGNQGGSRRSYPGAVSPAANAAEIVIGQVTGLRGWTPHAKTLNIPRRAKGKKAFSVPWERASAFRDTISE
jgi:hypothetical protein